MNLRVDVRQYPVRRESLGTVAGDGVTVVEVPHPVRVEADPFCRCPSLQKAVRLCRYVARCQDRGWQRPALWRCSKKSPSIAAEAGSGQSLEVELVWIEEIRDRKDAEDDQWRQYLRVLFARKVREHSPCVVEGEPGVGPFTK
jgi:hypothetical protein